LGGATWPVTRDPDPPVLESADGSFSTYSKRECKDGPPFVVVEAAKAGTAGFGSSGFCSYRLSFGCSTNLKKKGGRG